MSFRRQKIQKKRKAIPEAKNFKLLIKAAEEKPLAIKYKKVTNKIIEEAILKFLHLIIPLILREFIETSFFRMLRTVAYTIILFCNFVNNIT